MRRKTRKIRKLFNDYKPKSIYLKKSQNYTYDFPTVKISIDENRVALRNIFGNTEDILYRDYLIGSDYPTKAFVCFLEGMVNLKIASEYIDKILFINWENYIDVESAPSKNYLSILKEKVLNALNLNETKDFNIIVNHILSGQIALFIDGYDSVILIDVRESEGRSIEEPHTEANIRGPRDGFTEDLKVCTTLIRKRIKNPNLTFEKIILGTQTNTDIYIGYLRGIVNEKLVEEVKNRLKRIDTDSILESGYLEQFIEDNPFSPFATVGNSERPDSVAMKLLDGKVAILCNGTPFVLTVPYIFIDNMQTSEDMYIRPYLATILRSLRIIAFFITLTLPAFYVSLTTYHQEMVPSVLLITFASSREGIPFPALLETLLSEVIFQFLRESGVRMPRTVGQAVSIVGTLVIGEAAVSAGIIGAPMVIITALSAITSFIVPSTFDAILIMRIILIILSGILGLFGVFSVLFCMLTHMCSLRSYGTPYMAPMAPTIWYEMKDSILRAPLWLIKRRPISTTFRNSQRQANFQMPQKPNKTKGEKNK